MSQEVLDFAAAMDRVDNDTDLFFELIDMFFEDYESSLATLQAAVSGQLFGEIEAGAHAMKSALGNLGGMVAYEAAFELERAGRESIADDLTAKLQAFEAAVAAFQGAAEAKRG